MPDRINFVTRQIEKDELDQIMDEISFWELKEKNQIAHMQVFDNEDGTFFIAGQMWEDTTPYHIGCILNGIAYSWNECHKLGGYGGYVDNGERFSK